MTEEKLKELLIEYKKWLEDSLGNCITNQRYEIGNTYLIKEDVYRRCLRKLKELEEKTK